MGDVYLANDTKLDRRVALKVLPRDLANDERVRRFVQEAKAASALNHPNILTIYEIDEIDRQPFIATEFIDGSTLRERIQEGVVLPREAIDIGIQVASALNATHSVGIVHRDIKPETIMIRRDGIVKVLDFGLAKIARDRQITYTDPNAPTQAQVKTEAGIILGTAQYMSPEQARGLEVDVRTDIWSLGCVLYELVAARQPFQGSTTIDVMSGILRTEPESLERHLPNGPSEFGRIVNRALRKDREERYQNVKDMLIELKDLRVEVENQSKQSIISRNSTQSSDSLISQVHENAIAVLYFENMNTEPDSDYFCAGMTEDIITDLSKIKELKVVSRSDVLPYRNKEVNRRQVAETLRVNYILEGSVRKAGNKIRITAQLLDVREGYHIWAERFDRFIEDIFDLQNEVSQKIVEALKISLTDTEKELLNQKPTDNLRAYDFYMRGRELLYQKGKKNTESAIEMFGNAITLDPAFASSYAGLAEAFSAMYEWYDGSSQWLSKSIDVNQKALSLDPENLDALFGIAMVYFHHRRYAECKKSLEQILKTNSEFYPGYLRLGMLAEIADDLELALKHYRRAVKLKPYDEDAWRSLAGVYRKLEKNDLADDAALKVIEITSRKLEASLEDVIVMSRLAEAYARFGSREETKATLARVFELEPNDGLAIYNCSCAYALLGDKNAALLSLRRAYESGFKTVAHWAKRDSAFECLQKDAEFAQLVAELE